MKRRQLLVVFLVFDLAVAVLVVYNYGIFTAARRTMATVGTATAAAAQQPVAGLVPDLPPAVLALFAPLPAEATPPDYEISDALVALGRTLWYDRRLSIDQQVSCNTCHLLDR